MTRQLKLDLSTLHDRQLVSHLDYYFAKNMADVFHETSTVVIATCALVSKALADGHICLDLKKQADTRLNLFEQDLYIHFPCLEEWESALIGSSMVGKESAEIGRERDTDLERAFPLILDRNCHLYLARYYDLQKRLVSNLCSRVALSQAPIQALKNEAFVCKHLGPLFPGQNQQQVEKQKEAVQKALVHNFLVISGGPGTGKTHITTRIKTLLDLYAVFRNTRLPRIISVAPTGKAAGRLKGGRTIHSVLKPIKGSTHFVYTKHNPLPVDVVIVDEASMIDLSLMTRLLEAIPLDAKVILLGDKNQLSPVQAGAVFNDICRVKALESHLVFLTYNFRSRGKTGIENLARAINQNDVSTMETILTDANYPDVGFEESLGEERLEQLLEKYILNGYGSLTEQTDIFKGLENLDNFRILCAHNRGVAGTLQINHLCENILRSQANFDIRKHFFRKIVMIGVNDYSRGLFNGDTGIVHEEKRMVKAGFRDSTGNVRQFRYLDLPAHDTAFAITIHKSQGSEFDTVLILIPDKLSPIVTRQLLYTGVTRARKKAIIVGRLDVIKEAMTSTLDKGSPIGVLLEQRLGRNK